MPSVHSGARVLLVAKFNQRCHRTRGLDPLLRRPLARWVSWFPDSPHLLDLSLR